MRLYTVILFLCIAQVSGCRQEGRRQPLEVTYIANEGFMIAMGGTKVLIDALSRSEYYASPSDSTVAKLMGGIPPYDSVDYVFVTHGHADHYNAEMMSRFLLRHPAVQFIASSRTCSTLTGSGMEGRRGAGVELRIGEHRTIRGEKAEVDVVRLTHGANPDMNNFGFLVRSNGYTILHVGDALLQPNEELLRAIDWASCNVDLLFIEYFDHSSETRSILETLIKPKYVILMHIPEDDEEAVRNESEKVHPRLVIFGKEGETRRFETVEDGGQVR
jgi:L-ascorbate metabolism protein UlaG (beta-lactamase superfamily)